MDNTGYIALTRQSGLIREMQSVANNLANMSTTGYRHESVIFSEFVQRQDGAPSLSMTRAIGRNTSELQGALTQTGGAFDLALQGDGFFMVETAIGPQLTRAGNFSLDITGRLTTADGLAVLDAGETPIQIPVDESEIKIARDGTISGAEGPIAQLGVFQFTDPLDVSRRDGVLFHSDSGYEAVENPNILQGFVENSNVNPIVEITRMIEVQRSYEMGQEFLKREDERVKEAIRAVMRR